MKNFRKNMIKSRNGITLIALVITIIVLLILAGISISMLAGDNSILQRATDAKINTEKASEEEQIEIEILGSFNSNGNLELSTLKSNIKNSISGITIGETTEFPLEITFTSTGNSYTVDANGKVDRKIIIDRTGINIGDYIDYMPDVNSNTIYPLSTLSTYSGSTNNTADIAQDPINWQILRIYTDGSIDLIGSTTSQNIYFSGTNGYANGVYLMNDICKTLYSRNLDNITARSVNIEDFNYWLLQSNGGVTARNKWKIGAYTYGKEVIYKFNNKYPTIYKKQTDESDKGVLEANTDLIADGDLTVEQTCYTLSINETNFSDGHNALTSVNSYWLGSRTSQCFEFYSNFGLRYASTSINFTALVNSRGEQYDETNYQKHYLRPVVHLKSSVQITAKTGTTEDKHQITSY